MNYFAHVYNETKIWVDTAGHCNFNISIWYTIV